MDLIGLDRVVENQAWLLVFLFVLILVFAVNKLLYGERLYELMFTRFSRVYRAKYFGESQQVISVFNASLFCIQGWCMSLLLIGMHKYEFIQISNLPDGMIGFLLIWFLIASFFLLKMGIIYLLSNILSLNDVFFRLLSFVYNYYAVAALWFLPILIIILLVDDLDKFYLITTFFLFVISHVIVFLVLLSKNKYLLTNGLFYFILYLCTFEIAPILIVFKTFVY